MNLTPIPITIVGGFLGAGKTSLLNHILTNSSGRRVAVLVNDFGDINIDAKLIVSIEGETVSLTNGCVCCTIREDLLIEVLRVLATEPRPEYIVIETSGVSKPHQFARVPRHRNPSGGATDWTTINQPQAAYQLDHSSGRPHRLRRPIPPRGRAATLVPLADSGPRDRWSRSIGTTSADGSTPSVDAFGPIEEVQSGRKIVHARTGKLQTAGYLISRGTRALKTVADVPVRDTR